MTIDVLMLEEAKGDQIRWDCCCGYCCRCGCCYRFESHRSSSGERPKRVGDVYEPHHLFPRRCDAYDRNFRKGTGRLVVDRKWEQSTGMANRVVGWGHQGMGTGHIDPVGALGRHRDREGSSPKEGRCMVHQTIQEVEVHMAGSLVGGRSNLRARLVVVDRPIRAAEGNPPSVEGTRTTGWERREGTMATVGAHEPN